MFLYFFELLRISEKQSPACVSEEQTAEQSWDLAISRAIWLTIFLLQTWTLFGSGLNNNAVPPEAVLSLLSGVMFELPGAPQLANACLITDPLTQAKRGLWEPIGAVYTATANIPQQNDRTHEEGLIKHSAEFLLF